MARFISTLMVSLAFIASCKTTSPDKGKLRGASDEVQGPAQSAKPFDATAVCEALRNEEFPGSAVSVQIQWLCDRDGFTVLKDKAYRGYGDPQSFEYSGEHDKTLYYGAGMILDGSLADLKGINLMFCDDFEGLRARFGGEVLADVQSLQVAHREEGRCEYLQQAVSRWGVRADIKASATFGKFEAQNLNWRVDSMIAPLNYSPVKQFSVLSMSWEEDGKLHGAYLIRTQIQVSGFLMGSARSAMKSTVAKVMKGYHNFISSGQ